ncbi:hypothetical protein YTPLAS18_36130 [Nitrospira sp.]|nr:hypothetical protein YTPLAS18_36130 [Nitrospira sp.]
MNTFTLQLHGATQHERVEDVTAFVAHDASGSFGLLAGHERMMTSLPFGLARFRHADGDWEYLAVPKALVYFHESTLSVTCRRYLRDPDYERISQALEEQLRAEETALRGIKDSLERLEEEMLRRLWRLGRG